MKITFNPTHNLNFNANPKEIWCRGRHPNEWREKDWDTNAQLVGKEFDANGNLIDFSIHKGDVVVVGIHDDYDKKNDMPRIKFVTGRIVDYAGNMEGVNTVKIIDKRGQKLQHSPVNIFKGDLFSGAVEYLLGSKYRQQKLDVINKKRDEEVKDLDDSLAVLREINVHAKHDLAKFNIAG